MTKEILIHIDGAAKGNPGPAAIGLIGKDPGGATLFERFRYIGETTNNTAEYTALIEGLEIAREQGALRVRIASDSELLVRQMNGRYQVKKPHLKILYDQALQLIHGFEQVEIFHVPREKNAEADSLANRAIREQNRINNQNP
ncbi:MAG: ribonuclease H [Nitrospirae bacterium CG_4_9_14_3_um_filter_53_35]|nr:MAG: hypothetical protein AUK29_06625 [Nitrospirae bacterium CG2_30_53_67]PIS36985.1 MAG: ribonuclease H [Nitrospirae bacterium CG08_land_8_20_14_0_20_52_24]PIV85638.1 MAG: ribonuclease H [Nitrospirae bacterium CG17_big_fil_post_rev_8_21_14_2_50_50_9]PIW85468.1 MAG: ribonuclease H [Nitrospirae bacterium CG_4_8_14_3_um_filter_50_41]PIX85737.1 MAG: ribonuclease H [Nitrospirae bacterium CG_4_10_14_3_um_filter_53_41]PJA74373.1 MAG: ribonuclease H [Nitrospirae bacterium CG_4_9_14_3_um_filter_53_